MAKREIVGVMICPECGMTGAEVKRQKNGLLYRYCPECNAQYFPRTEDASARLGAKCGAVSVTDNTKGGGKPESGTGAARPVEAAPPTEPKPEAKPKPKSGLADALALMGVKP